MLKSILWWVIFIIAILLIGQFGWAIILGTISLGIIWVSYVVIRLMFYEVSDE